MKKKTMLLLMLACTVLFAGCAKSDAVDNEEMSAQIMEEDTETDEEDAEEPVEAEASEDKADAETVEEEGILVDMIVDDSPRTAGNIGQPGADQDSLTLVNRIGTEISSLSFRTNEYEEWGENRMDGSFSFSDGLSAAFYFDREILNDAGEKAESLDLKITTAEDNVFYFRNIPVYDIMQLTLRTVDSYSGTVPYATFLKTGSVNEESTIQAVMERLGLSAEDLPGGIPAVGDGAAAAYEAAQEPEAEVTRTPGEYTSDPSVANDMVGQEASRMVEALGEPQDGLYYSDDGGRGYYYYTDYTVFTSVDESGKEVIVQVEW